MKEISVPNLYSHSRCGHTHYELKGGSWLCKLRLTKPIEIDYMEKKMH